MLEFTELHPKAKQLSQVVSSEYRKNQQGLGWMIFFRAFSPIPVSEITKDVSTITKLADCLDSKKDLLLMKHLLNKKDHGVFSLDEFNDYKTKMLVGCYILKWRKYGSLIQASAHDVLLSHFKENLGVSALTEFSTQYINSCLDLFCIFCDFVDANKDTDEDYFSLNNSLGLSIQSEIHVARESSSQTSGLCGFMNVSALIMGK